MALGVKGSVGGRGTKAYQGVQGMSKSSATGSGTTTRMNNGVSAKKQPHMAIKSKKKKVIVSALLGMMKKGHSGSSASNDY